MRKLNLLALPVFAVLLSVCLAQCFKAYNSNDMSLLREWLMPGSLFLALWDGIQYLHKYYSSYVILDYLFLAACWVWWFRRPKILSAAAVFLFTFMGGPTAPIILVLLFGGYIGHT